jgi:PKD repeat protein
MITVAIIILLLSVSCYPVFAAPATPTPTEYTPTPTPSPTPTVYYGELYVSSTPPWADVDVDNGFFGVTPSSHLIPYGTHTITVFKQGYYSYSTTIDIESPGPYSINAILNQLPEESLTFSPPFSDTPVWYDSLGGYYWSLEQPPKLYKNWPYLIADMVNNPNAEPRNIMVTINETSVPGKTAHFEHIPPQNVTFPLYVPGVSAEEAQWQFRHDWDWLWLSQYENMYTNKNGQQVVDYSGMVFDLETKLYSLYYITKESDFFTVINKLNTYIFVAESAVSLYQLVKADYQTSYRYDFSSPDVSTPVSEIVTIQVPEYKQTDLKQGVLLGISSGVVIGAGIETVEYYGVGIALIAAGLYGMIKADDMMRAAADPDMNYTVPISIKSFDLPQLDQQPDSPIKEYALQNMHTAIDTEAYTDTYAKYEGALTANDTIWEIKLQKECYKYTSKLADDYQAEYAKAIPAVTYLQEMGYNPTEASVKSTSDEISHNGLPPATVQMLQELGYSDHEINSIKNITTNTPYSLVVNYNQSIPYLINISQQQAQQLNDEFGSDLGILAPPRAQFTSNVTSGHGPLNVAFIDESTRNATQWTWDFGDGQDSTLENPIHAYQNPGNYTVALTVSNDQGNDTRTQYNYIIVDGSFPPSANFTTNATTGVVPLVIQFSDVSTNSPTYWIWRFGDENISDSQNATYTFSSPGIYTVTLIAGNFAGTNSTTQIITVSPEVIPPAASFISNVTSGISPLSIQFNDTSTNSPNSWNWSFGDGTNSTSQNPIHIYTHPGQFTVSLTVTNNGGSNTTQISNYINVANLSQGVTVNLRNSLGNGIPGATVNYYSNGWKTFGVTDANGNASLVLSPGTYTFQMNYAGANENLLQTVNSNSVINFQTINVTAELLDGRGNLITPPNVGTVQYYANGWKYFGNINGGRCSLELLPVSYTFQMAYQGMTNNILQNVSQNELVVFQTTQPTVTVKFTNSTGGPISGGSINYYANGWKSFGTTDSNGSSTMDLLPGSYTFQINYIGGSENLVQNVSNTNATVYFQTKSVTVQLIDNNNNLITGANAGAVQYYANGWKNFGSTQGGITTLELLPVQYSFSMTYKGGITQEAQDISLNPLVTFQTGNVVSSSGNCTQYYANGWKAFTSGIQLLPASYSFSYTGGSPTRVINITAGIVNTIP